jgi:hypothetical protein
MLLTAVAISLSAMCTETQQCCEHPPWKSVCNPNPITNCEPVSDLYDLSTNCTGGRDGGPGGGRGGLGHLPFTSARQREREKGFGGTAAAAPEEAFCCHLNMAGFVWIYDEWGQYALAGYASLLTIAYAQLCFQAAACGCVQTWGASGRYW